MIPDNYIVIGKIRSTVGLKGMLNASLLTDFPERFKQLSEVYLFDERRSGKVCQYFIENAEIHSDFVKIKLKDVNTIDDAEKLKNHFILINEDERLSLDEGSYYFYDLIGCLAFSGGAKFGTVVAIENYGGGDLFKVLEDATGKEILIPYVESFVESINVEDKIINFNLIEGFLSDKI